MTTVPTEYDRQMSEVIELLTITQTDLKSLRAIQFMPAGERRMLANIRRLIVLIRKKIGALPMPPEPEPVSGAQIGNMIFDILMERQLGGYEDKAQAQLQALGFSDTVCAYLVGLAVLFPQPKTTLDKPHYHDCAHDIHYWIKDADVNSPLMRCEYCGKFWNMKTDERFDPVDLPVSMGGDIPDGSGLS